MNLPTKTAWLTLRFFCISNLAELFGWLLSTVTGCIWDSTGWYLMWQTLKHFFLCSCALWVTVFKGERWPPFCLKVPWILLGHRTAHETRADHPLREQQYNPSWERCTNISGIILTPKFHWKPLLQAIIFQFGYYPLEDTLLSWFTWLALKAHCSKWKYSHWLWGHLKTTLGQDPV